MKRLIILPLLLLSACAITPGEHAFLPLQFVPFVNSAYSRAYDVDRERRSQEIWALCNQYNVEPGDCPRTPGCKEGYDKIMAGFNKDFYRIIGPDATVHGYGEGGRASAITDATGKTVGYVAPPVAHGYGPAGKALPVTDTAGKVLGYIDSNGDYVPATGETINGTR